MYKLHLGSNKDVLKTFEDNSVDSIVTDPPYEYGFMGKSWDSSGIAYDVELWKECLRVVKPGGYIMAFGSSRTHHRLMVAIEDAGFEIRDTVCWVFGSGFPKSLNIGKKIDEIQGNEREDLGAGNDKGRTQTFGGSVPIPTRLTKGTSDFEGWGTALKPAVEYICMARKPLSEKTVAENCLKWGTGGINVDECRIVGTKEENDFDIKRGGYKDGVNHIMKTNKDLKFNVSIIPQTDHNPFDHVSKGRFPANLITDGSEEVRECFPETKSGGRNIHSKKTHWGTGEITADISNLDSSGNASRFFKSIPQGRFPANLIHDNSEEVRECFPETHAPCNKTTHKGGNQFGVGNIDDKRDGGGFSGYTDSGNASRFFKSIIYQAKPSKAERNRGCEAVFNLFEQSEGLEKKKANNKSGNDRGTKCSDCNLTHNGSNDHSDCSGERVYYEPHPRLNNHPTVKPIALMEYLIKMVTPKGGIVLDPFNGSGSTGCAAVKNRFDYIGIDITEDYIKISEKRIKSYQR